MAAKIATGALGALNAASAVFTSDGGPFYMNVWGTFVGTLTLQASVDGGTTWLPVKNDGAVAVTATAPGRQIVFDMEMNVKYRVQMTAYTSGSASVTLSA